MSVDRDDPDIIVLGTGVAGLVAAISAARAGLKTLLLEKSSQWGGTTAMSGGVVWLPANDLMVRDGEADSAADIDAYMAEITAQDGPAASPARRQAFIANAPETMRFLAAEGVPWSRLPGYPDYESERTGARLGRCVETAIFDGRQLGGWLDSLRKPTAELPVFETVHAVKLPHAKRRLGPMALALRIGILDRIRRLIGQKPLARGAALAGRLMLVALKAGVEVRLNVRTTALLRGDDGRVTGVTTTEGAIASRAGVILCCGGFAANADMRRKYQGMSAEWSNASPEDDGDAITLGQETGAALAIMDSSWWMPTVPTEGGGKTITVPHRSLPGSIIVDSSARRYVDEAASYMLVGRAMIERDRTVPAVPSWLIVESRYWRNYLTGIEPTTPAGRARMKAAGQFAEADSIAELAVACGLPVDALTETVERFNGFAREGVDADFGRGSSRYDRYWGDPGHRPNPALGPIEQGPFTALRIWAGDIGTNGGLLTDENGRVLDAEDRPIAGLWAAGNASASVMGRSYAGAGATIGAAAVFGRIAARDAARSIAGA